jgi:vacuolar protein sorting-associated protein 13A/C
VTGLVTRPIEGAEREGLGGFLKGFGKGVVGAVTKPVVGVFDLASNVTEGIRNTTTVFDTNEVDRVRLPRYVGRDGILRKYEQREALGQSWLKEIDNGKYFYDDFIAHCPVQSDELVAILTYNRIMLVRTKKLTVDWEIPFHDIQTIKCEATGIAVYLRPGNPGPFLPISEKSSRDWFFKKIEEAVTNYNADKRPVD